MKISNIKRMTLTALCIALCVVVPMAFHVIPNAGAVMLPMHLPVLLAGYLCGPWWGMAVGAVAPLLRHVWLGMPPLVTALGMTFELGTYGLVVGLTYRILPKSLAGIYTSLLCAMVAGRAVWGCAMMVIMGVSGNPFTWSAFLAGALLNAIPGIAVQLVLIPLLVISLRRARII